MNNFDFFKTIISLKILGQILANLYLFQLKEYRFDRLKEHIFRVYKNLPKAFLYLTIFSPFKIPKLTLKILIFFISSLAFYIYLYFLLDRLLYATLIFSTPFLIIFISLIFYPFHKILELILLKATEKKIKKFQKENNLLVIGITGSFGKSTTKFFLHQLLSKKYQTITTPGSVNTPLGISLFFFKNLNKNHQICIVEMGAYRRGEIKELCQIVNPKIGIITGISNQHLALFGNQENIIKAKSELIFSLPKNGLAIINRKSPYLPMIPKEKNLKVEFYGDNNFLDFKTNLPEFLINNLLPAKIIAKKLGFKDEEIKKIITDLKAPPKTMNQVLGYAGSLIIDDSYNSNYYGVLSAFEYVKKFPQKKILIMPCLIELGKESEKIHQNLGKKIFEIFDLAIITTEDYFYHLKKDFWGSNKIQLIINPKVIIDKLKDNVNENTVILIEGRVNQLIREFLINKLPKDTIVIGVSPNLQKDDYLLAKKIFFQPQLNSKDNNINSLKKAIKDKFGFKYVFLTNSARSAFYLLLKSLELPKNTQIAVQGLNCNAVVNPILWAGLKPIFIDIDQSWNLDYKDLERHINSNLKGVVVQHSFGVPAKLEPIMALCKKNNLYLFEDLALSLGAKYNQKFCGHFGIASFLSFGRDKIISSVFGGALVTNNSHLAQKIEKKYQKISYPPILWSYQQLLHPIITYKLLPIYHYKLVRLLLFIFQRFLLLSKPIYLEEHRASKPYLFPKKLPNHLAALALNQLKKIDYLNEHRKYIANIYKKNLCLKTQKINEKSDPIYLRYNIVIDKAQKLITRLRKKKIYLGDWYTQVIDPKETDLKKIGYQIGKCPNAEKIAGRIINLPTHINIKKADALYLINNLNDLIKKND